MDYTDIPADRASLLARLGWLRQQTHELERALGMTSSRTDWAEGSLLAPKDTAGSLLAQYAADFVSVHASNGDYLYASPSVKALLGYSPAELLGRNAYELFHPDDLERIARNHAHQGEDGTRPIEYRIRDTQGEWRWVQTRSRAECNTDGVERIVCITRDIHERKQVELDNARLRGEFQRLAHADDPDALPER
jgi:PAS domain S-box-containing protein